jgi:hypothetical protein
MRETVTINGAKILEQIHERGLTLQKVGKLVGCTGQCIGKWLKRNEMPNDLFNKIVVAINTNPLQDLGVDMDGDIFIYNGKPVFINLQAYYHAGWEACKNSMIEVIRNQLY